MGVQGEVGTGLALGAAAGEEAAEGEEEAAAEEVVVEPERVAGNPQNPRLETAVLLAGSGTAPSGLA